ncbi:hypothetical protein ACWD5R_44440, partial [Streptomyces sp. NPDC002514]
MQRAEPLELREEQADDALHLLVRIKRELPGRAADIAAGQGEGQLAAAGLVQAPAPHPLPDQVAFGLAHRALEPQQQPVDVLGQVVVNRPGFDGDIEDPEGSCSWLLLVSTPMNSASA